MTDVSITPLPAAPLQVLEIWSHPHAVNERFTAASGFALPQRGQAAGSDGLRLMRFEPAVWLVEGDASQLVDILDNDGAITDISGSIVRVRLSGLGWRALLMEGGIFDAESPNFAVGCCAATIIDHVNVRLHVVSDNACDVYVQMSYSAGLIHFWRQAAKISLGIV